MEMQTFQSYYKLRFVFSWEEYADSACLISRKFPMPGASSCSHVSRLSAPTPAMLPATGHLHSTSLACTANTRLRLSHSRGEVGGSDDVLTSCDLEQDGPDASWVPSLCPTTLSSADGEAPQSCRHLLLNLIVPVPHAPLESRKIPVCRC